MSNISLTQVNPGSQGAFTPYGEVRDFMMCRDSMSFICGVADAGKELSVSTPILTPSGWIPIGDIKVGDLVYSQDGTATTVTGVYPQGIKQSYKVSFSDNTSVEAGAEHLWFVWTKIQRDVFLNPKKQIRGRTGNGKILTTMDIKNNIHKRFNIPMIEPIQYSKKELLIHPYVMGVLIGDGCISSVIKLTSADEFILNKVSELIKDYYYLKSQTKYDYSLNLKDLKNNPYKQYFQSLEGTFKSWNKYIPREYLMSCIEDRINLLQGLIDTDGFIDKAGRIEYTSSSERLIKDVLELVQSLGGQGTLRSKIPTYTHKGEKVKGRKSYTLQIKLPKGIVPVSLPRKIERLNKKKYFPYRKIVSIEPTEMREMVCISVEHPSRLYVVNDFIVTHNTYACCWKMHLFAIKYPGSRILMCRKNATALRNSAVITYQKVLKQSGYDKLVKTLGKSQPDSFTYPYSRVKDSRDGRVYEGQSIIVIGNLDKSSEHLGAEYDLIYVNQPEEIAEEDWEYLMTRASGRAGNAPYALLFGDPNPSYAKHWIKQGYDKGRWKIFSPTHKDNPLLWDDNKKDWTPEGKIRVDALSKTTGHRRDRLYLGNWVDTEGLVYGDVWDDEKHVIGSQTFDIAPSWKRYVTVDFGFTAPTVMAMYAQNPSSGMLIRTDLIYRTGHTINENGELLRQMLNTVDGSSIKAIITDRSPGEVKVLQQILGRGVQQAKKGAGSRDVSVDLLTKRLKGDMIKFVHTDEALFHKKDPALVAKQKPIGLPDEIGNYRYDNKGDGTVMKEDDHEIDSCHYLVRYLDGGKRIIPILWI